MTKVKTIKSAQELFIEFLREHNALIPFCINLATVKHNDIPRRSLFQWLNDEEVEPLKWVIGISNKYSPFIWRHTSEYVVYWSDLDDKWKALYANHTHLPLKGRTTRRNQYLCMTSSYYYFLESKVYTSVKKDHNNDDIIIDQDGDRQAINTYSCGLDSQEFKLIEPKY